MLACLNSFVQENIDWASRISAPVPGMGSKDAVVSTQASPLLSDGSFQLAVTGQQLLGYTVILSSDNKSEKPYFLSYFLF